MKNTTDRGRSVHGCGIAVKPVTVGLSLLLACTAMGASFLASKNVKAEEERKPLAAVAVTAEPLVATAVAADSVKAAEPLTAVSYAEEALTAVSVVEEEVPLEAVQEEEEPLVADSLIPEVAKPESYVNDYLGFTRTELVSYLV